MSRIVVKNLPKKITAKNLEELFASKGTITDLQLKHNNKGMFRGFAFVGFKTEEEANAAKEYFHNTFVNTSKIKIEICHDLGDSNKPKSWKKKNIEANAHNEYPKKTSTQKSSKKKVNDIPEELKEDPQFKEFLNINKSRTSKPAWAEDVDLDTNSETEEHDDGVKNDSEVENSSENKHKQNTNRKKHDFLYTVKIKNLPFQCKKSQIKKFLEPLQIISLRRPPKTKGFAFVGFKTEKDLKRALIKHKGFLDGRRVDVVKFEKTNESNQSNHENFNENRDKELNEELLAETGRIYVRNLCFDVAEDDLKNLFSKFGPVEIHLPMDFMTKKAKGYAFVTFLFAEHAVKAWTELDGKIFQGRMLHLIPAKPQKEYEVDENETNFKKKKEDKKKKESGSSHNWNILFLGMNAVADVVAEKYGVEKSALLSGNSWRSSKMNDEFKSLSLPVRMALAETEMVENTRKFLIKNGVQLDAFSQPAAERSKTVIVVKHLPAKTTAEEINELFEKYGTISRTLVPPSGLVALVDFENPTEARTAFTKLAYKQFKTDPLYLEWAPIGGLTEPKPDESGENENEEAANEEKTEEENSAPKDEVSPEIGSTIYIKNIDFKTTQSDFQKHFQQCGPILHATISTRKDIQTGKTLSMGFGFVQFATKEAAVFALQNLQHSVLDGHALEMKFSNRKKNPSAVSIRKKYDVKKQISSKIMVRNVPFQASVKEFKQLFKGFGELENVRLPQKIGKPGEHRGFGFVEYANLEDAQRAFDALCHSTHLYNRRLVLEWANPDSDSVAEIRKKTAEEYAESQPKNKKMKKSQLKEDILVAAARHAVHNDGADFDE